MEKASPFIYYADAVELSLMRFYHGFHGPLSVIPYQIIGITAFFGFDDNVPLLLVMSRHSQDMYHISILECVAASDGIVVWLFGTRVGSVESVGGDADGEFLLFSLVRLGLGFHYFFIVFITRRNIAGNCSKSQIEGNRYDGRYDGF